MKNINFFGIFKIFFVGIGFIFLLQLCFGEFNIFNYLRKQTEVKVKQESLLKQENLKQLYINEITILRNPNIIDIDIVSREVIRKLNKIPNGYFILNWD